MQMDTTTATTTASRIAEAMRFRQRLLALQSEIEEWAGQPADSDQAGRAIGHVEAAQMDLLAYAESLAQQEEPTAAAA